VVEPGIRTTGPTPLMFPTATGRRRDRNNIRNRVLSPSFHGPRRCCASAGTTTASTRERNTDGKRITHVPTHAGRRTAITWWAEAGYDERDVMLWVGHEDPVLTLRLYRQARNRPRDPRVAAAMAGVSAKERRVLRHLWAV
jgi:integrase